MSMITAIEQFGILITADSIKTKFLDMEPVDANETKNSLASVVGKNWYKRKSSKDTNTSRQSGQTSRVSTTTKTGK